MVNIIPLRSHLCSGGSSRPGVCMGGHHVVVPCPSLPSSACSDSRARPWISHSGGITLWGTPQKLQIGPLLPQGQSLNTDHTSLSVSPWQQGPSQQEGLRRERARRGEAAESESGSNLPQMAENMVPKAELGLLTSRLGQLRQAASSPGGAFQGIPEKTAPRSWGCCSEVQWGLPVWTAGQSRVCSHWCPS